MCCPFSSAAAGEETAHFALRFAGAVRLAVDALGFDDRVAEVAVFQTAQPVLVRRTAPGGSRLNLAASPFA